MRQMTDKERQAMSRLEDFFVDYMGMEEFSNALRNQIRASINMYLSSGSIEWADDLERAYMPIEEFCDRLEGIKRD